jgi:CBS domain-containing protein
VLVMEEGTLEGIFTERDLVCWLGTSDTSL